ncbi:MAG: hypothetical protein PHC75_02850 [Burkholderiales bacterium]|nr:hypothetical protein [Burkholderiales bacterium]
MNKIFVLFFMSFCIGKSLYAGASGFGVQSTSFDSGLEQHGAFLADDLLTSPLLRSMFNVSAVKINNDLVRVCINDQFSECKIVKSSAKVYLETVNGRVRFEKDE